MGSKNKQPAATVVKPIVIAPSPAAEFPAAAPPARATGYEIAAWIMLGIALLFTLWYQLVPALLTGLFVYSMVHRIAGHMSYLKMTGNRAKIMAISILSLLMVGVSAGIIFALLALVHGKVGGIPQMLDRITHIIEQIRPWMTQKGVGHWIPEADKVGERIIEWYREHAAEFKHLGSETAKMFLHSVIGIVIGAMLSFHTVLPGGPLAAALSERMSRFAKAFEAVVFAQVKISALNTAFTAIYLLVVLPLFGVDLPFRHTLVIVTFIAGLLPVIGNLISNTVIVLISMGVGPQVAISSLAFLVIIHKLEYFLNAKIVGGEIHAAAWEILLAMVAFEVAFGIPGVVIAPVVYAYVKAELTDKQLV